ARIPKEGPLQGYLYIVLGSEKYDSVVHQLQNSFILKLSLLALVASLAVALLAGTG
ncbi:MAG: sensor histidine kinase, partial [Desulfuromonadales bacterium]|nr:sensor histidine kinase [Desulfuromonadales bacterium]